MSGGLIKVEYLKQLTIQGKMKNIIFWIHDFLETDEKLVVFATHRKTIRVLMDEFGKSAISMVGSDAPYKKQNVVDQFQTNNKIRLFLGMMDNQGKPAGVGHTLTAASNVAFSELQWSPGVHDQAADRVHRIGQRYPVNIHYLLAANTIEEKIAEILDRKRKIVSEILDGKQDREIPMILELMRLYSKKKSD
jgi:SWI/SNF-related matrix-associated actin-dependent regulator 1 of chromatin subfamily A